MTITWGNSTLKTQKTLQPYRFCSIIKRDTKRLLRRHHILSSRELMRRKLNLDDTWYNKTSKIRSTKPKINLQIWAEDFKRLWHLVCERTQQLQIIIRGQYWSRNKNKLTPVTSMHLMAASWPVLTCRPCRETNIG